MVKYLEQLDVGLQEFAGRQPILVCDCAPMHVTEKVFRTVARLHIWLVLVPPACTFVLQPADVGVIQHVKADLRQRQEDSKAAFAEARVPTQNWVRSLLTVKRFLSKRSWKSVFKRCGILGDRAELPAALQDLRHAVFCETDGVARFPTSKTMGKFYPKSIAKKFWLLLQPTLSQLD